MADATPSISALRWRARAWAALAKHCDVWVAARAMKARRKALRRLLEEYGITPPKPLVLPVDIALSRIAYFARPANVMRGGMRDEVFVVHTAGLNIVGVFNTIEECERAARRHDLRKHCNRKTKEFITAVDRMAVKSREDLEYAQTIKEGS